MARRRFPLVDVLIGTPSSGNRYGAPALLPHGVVVELFADEACTTVLDATDLAGNPITSVVVDGVAIPPFMGPPDDTVRVYGRPVDSTGGPFEIYAADVTLPERLEEANLDAHNDARYIARGSLVFDVHDYGAVGDGVADDTAAIQAAADAALAASSDARLFLRSRTYRIVGTVQVACHLDADQATLRYEGTGTALVIGVNTTGSLTARKRFLLPRVVKASADWAGSSVGVLTVNLNACEVYVPFVQSFARGLVVYGFGGGNAYNTYRLGALWQNRRNLVLDCDATGYANQNAFLGGRLQQTISGGATNDDTSANQILLGETAGAAPNNNTFLNTSFEGDNPAYYRLDVHGRYNKFVNCRWENFGGESRVRWNADASYNQIEHGYDADALVETVVAGSAGNEIRGRFAAAIKAGNTSGQSINPSTWTALTGWTVDGLTKRASYVAGNGSFVPRQGVWSFRGQVMFAGRAGGVRRAAFYVDGTSLDIGDTPNTGSGNLAVKAEGIYRFDGIQALTLRAWHDTSTPLSLIASSGYNYIHAEWIGP